MVVMPVYTYIHGASAYRDRKWIHDLSVKRTKRAWEVGRPKMTVNEATKRALQLEVTR